MVPRAPTSSIRRLLEERLAQLSDEADALYQQGRERARRFIRQGRPKAGAELAMTQWPSSPKRPTELLEGLAGRSTNCLDSGPSFVLCSHHRWTKARR